MLKKVINILNSNHECIYLLIEFKTDYVINNCDTLKRIYMLRYLLNTVIAYEYTTDKMNK